jgi:hypothetical protein
MNNLQKVHPEPVQRENSEFTDSARDEINRQLEELDKHSGKDANDIHPKPVRFIECRKKKRIDVIRERLNATVVHTMEPNKK